MRDPALHIRCSDFLTIASKYGLSKHDVNQLMQDAFKYSIRNRVFVTTKAQGKKKADRSKEADNQSLEQFNRIYQGVIVSKSIKALSIGKTSPQYLTLKEVCQQAVEFCTLFGLDHEEGMKMYVEMGIKLLGSKFGIYRLKGTAQRIVDYHRDVLIIMKDMDPEKTDVMVLAWATAVRTYYNTTIQLEDDAQRAHFIQARDAAELVNADYYDWMYAQFEKYLYLNNIPAFSQFYGDQAKLNYQLYMAKVKPNKVSKEEQEYFNIVKNAKEIPIKATQQAARIRKERLHNSV